MLLRMDYDDVERQRIAQGVRDARVERQWGKEEAARHAGISSITWKRVEDGLRVQRIKLRAIEVALGWGFGSMDRLARGRTVAHKNPDPIETIRQVNLFGHPKRDDALMKGLSAVTQFAHDCGARGAPERLVDDFIGDAFMLLDAVSVAKRHQDLNSLNSDEHEERDHDDPTPTKQAGASPAKQVRQLRPAPPAEGEAPSREWLAYLQERQDAADSASVEYIEEQAAYRDDTMGDDDS